MKSQVVSFIAAMVSVGLAGSASEGLGNEAAAAAKGGPQILFTNVNVWDGASEDLRKADVLVEGNLIKAIGAGLQSSGAKVINGGGRTLMPGLIEGHGHLQMNGNSLADIVNNRSLEELAVRDLQGHALI